MVFVWSGFSVAGSADKDATIDLKKVAEQLERENQARLKIHNFPHIVSKRSAKKLHIKTEFSSYDDPISYNLLNPLLIVKHLENENRQNFYTDSFMDKYSERILVNWNKVLEDLSSPSVFKRLKTIESLQEDPHFSSITPKGLIRVKIQIQEKLASISIFDPFIKARIKAIKALELQFPWSSDVVMYNLIVSLYDISLRVRKQAFNTISRLRYDETANEFIQKTKVHVHNFIQSSPKNTTHSDDLPWQTQNSTIRQLSFLVSLTKKHLESNITTVRELADLLSTESTVHILVALRKLKKLDNLKDPHTLNKIAEGLFHPRVIVRHKSLKLLEKFQPDDIGIFEKMAIATGWGKRTMLSLNILNLLTQLLHKSTKYQAYVGKDSIIVTNIMKLIDHHEPMIKKMAIRFLLTIDVSFEVVFMVMKKVISSSNISNIAMNDIIKAYEMFNLLPLFKKKQVYGMFLHSSTSVLNRFKSGLSKEEVAQLQARGNDLKEVGLVNKKPSPIVGKENATCQKVFNNKGGNNE